MIRVLKACAVRRQARGNQRFKNYINAVQHLSITWF